jgi:hypothetical protein
MSPGQPRFPLPRSGHENDHRAGAAAPEVEATAHSLGDLDHTAMPSGRAVLRRVAGDDRLRDFGNQAAREM